MVERCSELHDAWQAGARAAKSQPSQPAKCVDGFARGPGLVDVLSRPCELLTRLGVVHAGAHAKAATVCEQALVHIHIPLGDGCDEPCWQLQKCSSAAMRRPCRSGWQDAHGIVILHWHFWQDLQCQVLQSAQCPHFRQCLVWEMSTTPPRQKEKKHPSPMSKPRSEQNAWTRLRSSLPGRILGLYFHWW